MGTTVPSLLEQQIPMAHLSTVERAKRMCDKFLSASLTLPQAKTQLVNHVFTVRLANRKWAVRNFSELPLCVRTILTQAQIRQILDRELQTTTPSVEIMAVVYH